ncbi:MAG: heavy metal translocating P-type ATPase metal-binding domain-containing protein [bacterium]
MAEVKEASKTKCHHCGEPSGGNAISVNGKFFCCSGCRTVYEILNQSDLCSYYDLENNFQKRIETGNDTIKFDYLDDIEIQNKIISFTGNKISTVTFLIPGIHCSSCIWLLEKLNKIDHGIISTKVNFLNKEVLVVFDNSLISLKQVVKLLVSIGYEPVISLPDKNSQINDNSSYLKKLYLRIGVAGFCLSNIMLLSFPEYLSFGSFPEPALKTFFNYLTIILSLPVFFYCSSIYFVPAWRSLKNKHISIDVPISMGLIALFIRSLFETIIFNNAGYSDSLAGLVFLLLLGKLFQSKMYETMNFERDYKSYFPVSVTIKKAGQMKTLPIAQLKKGDRIIIRNNEIIPADSILFNGSGKIDYSFVTGESTPELKVPGEIIYAGGRHNGSVLELEVLKPVSQSYLTRLWNNSAFEKKSDYTISSLTDSVSKYFTYAILFIAFSSAFYWYSTDINLALNAFTTVLIVACPCAFALTTPFALGNALRILGRNKFYLKNSLVVEKLANINAVVFDKTGTITRSNDASVKYTGCELKLCELAMVKSLVNNSFHPLSKMIYDTIPIKGLYATDNFTEIAGKGISCHINGKKIRLGILPFILEDLENEFYDLKNESSRNTLLTSAILSIDDEIKGFYSFGNKYREGLSEVLIMLRKKYELSMVSGDNESEKNNLRRLFDDNELLLFSQSPSNKLQYIKSLQSKGKNVLMVGDGLNDAGAIKQSNAGISVAENISNFSPACDAILDASVFSKLDQLLKFSATTMKVIKVSFAISFLYNVIGLYIAAQGTFSPLIAAILMPFNSVSIILFVTGTTNYFAKKRNLL